MDMLVFAGASVAKIAVVMVTVLLTVAVLTLAERKVLSWMQDRMGPMEVGPYGILQPIADGIKLFFKEDIIPSGANWLLFSLAPLISLVPAFIGFAVVPYGPNQEIELFGVTIKPFIISDINIGILYVLAFASIGAYGVILGGWQSPFPFSLLPEGLVWIENVFWFTVKVYFFLFLFFWIRATLPRLRYDQLMRFGWKVLLPLALANVLLTSIVVYVIR